MINTYEDGEEVYSDVATNDTCARLDPLTDPSARYRPDTDTTEVTYCIEGLFGTAVEEYTIQWDTYSDSCTLVDPVLTLVEDVDEDTFANNCDDDDDDDGLLDAPRQLPIGTKQWTDRVCSRRGWIPQNMVADTRISSEWYYDYWLSSFA